MKLEQSEKADVLFLYPPLHRLYGERKQWMPLSILCLSTYLTESGIPSKAYNADCDLREPERILSYTERFEAGKCFLQNLHGDNYIWQEVNEVLQKVSPCIVGISVLTEALGSVKRSVEIIRKLLPSSVIIAGGPHAEIDAEYLINCLGFDYVVKGDGEETLRFLCDAILHNKKIPITKRIITSAQVPMCKLPVPLLETHINFNAYKKVGKKLNITTSRGGCPFSCSFCYCSKYKYNLRFQSPDFVIKEIAHHVEYYGTRKLFFVDDTFTLKKDYISAICKGIIQNNISVSWTCTTRAGEVDAELLSLMKLAGCRSIHLGIESGSQRILKLLNKKINFNMVDESVFLIKNSGIDCRMFFMAGLPTESSEDLEATIQCIRHYSPAETILDIYVPIPGTALFNYICKMGVRIDNIDWCTFSRDQVPYLQYVNNEDGLYDTKLQELFDVVEEMNHRKG